MIVSERMETGKFQPSGLLDAVHDIEGLDRLPGGAFHQVVNGADDDEPV